MEQSKMRQLAIMLNVCAIAVLLSGLLLLVGGILSTLLGSTEVAHDVKRAITLHPELEPFEAVELEFRKGRWMPLIVHGSLGGLQTILGTILFVGISKSGLLGESPRPAGGPK